MRFPWIFDWIAWCWIWYWPSLIVCIALTLGHKAWSVSQHRFWSPLIGDWCDIVLVVFVGFCLWVVLCAIRNGYGVG